MKPWVPIIAALLGITLPTSAGSVEPTKEATLRLVLSEVQVGQSTSEQYCMLVFDDHNFHSEKASRVRGKDKERKVYQGRLSDADWNALRAILDTKQLRELHVPQGVPSLVVRDLHPYTISIAREDGFQNMEFLNKESLKPYESSVKPLLQWWKSARNLPTEEANVATDSRCSLSNVNGIFNN
jgi:hypothetical protein